MLRNSYALLQKIITQVTGSIAFVPALLSCLSFVLGIVLVSLDMDWITAIIIRVPLVSINDIETLRSVLTTFLMGVISILVFSFSMVMVVLNQTASRYSPRVLNWLIGKRNNQYVLGTYLSCIVLTLVLLINLPLNNSFTPGYRFGIFLDTCLVFICIIMFVNLINSVSTDLQISNITDNIYKRTIERMEKEKTNVSKEDLDHMEEHTWYPYPVESPGYLQHIGQDQLLKIASKNDVRLKIILNTGKYYMTGEALFYLDKNDVAEKLSKQIHSHFVFYNGERIQDNSYYGFKQLSEIAVKALSPGINDPRTANSCIDYLTELFLCWMCKDDARYIRDKKKEVRILIYPRTLTDLIDICLLPILNYGSKDVNILQSMLVMIRKLGERDEKKMYRESLNAFLKALLSEADRSNPYFFDYLQKYREEIMQVKDNYFYAAHDRSV